MKFEPSSEFDYNEYMGWLGGHGMEKIDIYNLKDEDNIYKKLKGHIIISRRSAHRGRFDGQEKFKFSNKFTNKNFNDFKKLIKENIDELIQNLNSRWIVSILECFFDSGNSDEKISSLVISFMYNTKEFSDDMFGIVDTYRKENFKHEGDTFLWMFERLKDSMTEDTEPLVVELVKEFFEDENFILNRLNQFHNRDIKKEVLSLFVENRYSVWSAETDEYVGSYPYVK